MERILQREGCLGEGEICVRKRNLLSEEGKEDSDLLFLKWYINFFKD